MNERGELAAWRAAIDDLLGGRVLGDEGGGAGVESAEQLVVAGVHGQNDDPEVRVRLTRRSGGVEAAAVRQSNVEDDDVRA